MKRPSPATMLVGHPIPSMLALIAGLALIAAALRADEGGWVVILLVVIALARVGQAANQYNAYTAWKRQWDAMGDGPVRQLRLGRSGKRIILLGLVLAMGFYLYAQREQPGYAFAFGWMVVGGMVGGLVLLVCALRARAGRKGRRMSDEPVTICARPLLPTPPVRRAYDALPEHCRRILDVGR